ncbi:MAG: methyltransferase-like protein [Candidatus Gottesmanbacteria bacterium GW2011_GWA1_34_13]|uniref:Methyltransferase-like protein n=1 Tax=Candidatus Gottesmanbacteria bacterium GW2011_GWA1_34_13 TaxID=1618434 RepID=A0A0G0DXV8_9BACT|nr:MAG: methyltransferase-like protein [Candidatus Gottesmanbacteria bacterium GW2011_GWA1_34_13]
MKTITKIEICRICKNNNLKDVFNFGPTPLANAFINEKNLNKKETFYPLIVCFCQKCYLLQLRYVVSPKILFKDYVYYSSTSSVFIKHFQDFADHVTKTLHLKNNSLCIDIGSNDGILLKPLKKLNMRVLGVEPAKNVAKTAIDQKITTLPEFFNIKLAKKIFNKYGSADIVCATNVFAHIHDLDEIINGVKIILNKNGVFIIEAPYLIDFLQNNLFDTVYHEHLSYLSVVPLQILFNRFNMKIFRAERVNSHGGSLRVFVALNESKYKVQSSVIKLLKEEKRLKLNSLNTYLNFSKRIENNKITLLNVLNTLISKGKRIAGYGAPAKGNTLLNYFGINNKIIEYIIEDSIYKQGLYTPGTRIPIVKSEKLYKDKPDYLFILAWNFAESIMKNHKNFRKWGKFILPVPKPRII